MNMWKYNLSKHSVEEQPTIIPPKRYAGYKDEWKVYHEHIASLRSTHVSGKVDWKDGEDVTGKFVEQHQEKTFTKPPDNWANCSEDQYNRINKLFKRIVAIPIIQDQPQTDPEIKKAIDDWCNEMGEIKKEYELKNQSQEQPSPLPLIEALKKIEQMSDCGSYEDAIVRMKSIATDALKNVPVIDNGEEAKKVLKEVYIELAEEMGKLANQKEFDTPNRLKGYEDALWDLKIIIQDKANISLSTITINDVKNKNL